MQEKENQEKTMRTRTDIKKDMAHEIARVMRLNRLNLQHGKRIEYQKNCCYLAGINKMKNIVGL